MSVQRPNPPNPDLADWTYDDEIDLRQYVDVTFKWWREIVTFAVVGAVLGHSIARDIMRQDTGTGVREVETVQRCETVYQSHEEERIMGYNVTYHYNGQDYTVRTDSDPGSQIRVRVSVEPVL